MKCFCYLVSEKFLSVGARAGTRAPSRGSAESWRWGAGRGRAGRDLHGSAACHVASEPVFARRVGIENSVRQHEFDNSLIVLAPESSDLLTGELVYTAVNRTLVL
jgi:hypothetical protein